MRNHRRCRRPRAASISSPSRMYALPSLMWWNSMTCVASRRHVRQERARRRRVEAPRRRAARLVEHRAGQLHDAQEFGECIHRKPLGKFCGRTIKRARRWQRDQFLRPARQSSAPHGAPKIAPLATRSFHARIMPEPPTPRPPSIDEASPQRAARPRDHRRRRHVARAARADRRPPRTVSRARRVRRAHLERARAAHGDPRALRARVAQRERRVGIRATTCRSPASTASRPSRP